ncbi:tail fiber protein [Vibrio sp. Of7-15]|uniref:phage tail protein n=1 Tax=Vibrio sp. Of7-15 TaxID=2724879 RepID=UPI001EF16693|nr:tail fiber protein [Vibrio sp. Of7-15]MCG7499824.1 tail fiber protein [Vibrio sp. Of7-15]
MKKMFKRSLYSACLLPSLLITNPAHACSSEPLIGTMCVFAGNFAPSGYAFADGQLLSIASNTALFSILGTTYGGNGETTFALPDARGRVLIGARQGPGLESYSLGQKGGEETVVLSTSHLPSHTHSATTSITNTLDAGGAATLHANNGSSTETDPENNALGDSPNREEIYTPNPPNVAMHTDSISLTITGSVDSVATTMISNTGGSLAHENRMPYLTVNWIIALVGIFPSG